MIKNPIKRPAGKVFAVLLVLGLAACLFPVNLAAFAFSNGQSASIVLGQSSFTTNAAPTPPTAASESGPVSIAFDSAGNLWVADNFNSRSLEYLKGSGFTSGASASIVLGQSSFTTNAAPTPPTAASENFPNGIAFDSAGNFWVADASNSRSLEYLGPVVPPSVSVPEFPVGGMALLLVVSAAAYAVIRYRAISPSSLRISV